MTKKGKVILTSVLATIAICLIVVFSVLASKGYFSKYDGKITVEYVNIDGEVVETKDIKFITGDSLMDLVEDNFDNVTYDSGMIMSICDYTSPDDWSTFICIYVDGEMSMVGIADIIFTDGTIISFRVTTNTWS